MGEDHPAEKMRFSGNFVTIRTGSENSIQEFHVHEDVVKEKSNFLKAAFDRRWREGQSRVLELPEDTPATISAYLEWLYSRSIQPPPVEPGTGHRFERLVRLYVFGKKIQDDAFCDAVMRLMAQKCDQEHEEDEECVAWVPNQDDIELLYAGTPQGSPARRFLVDVHLACADADWLDENEEEGENPRELLLDLSRALRKGRTPGGQWAAVPHVSDWLKEKDP
ncbi:hypothetical protein CLAFUW4_09110 [Fulvia fulva]|nr:hypothetical protein CLAFUR4_09116 [Fulvia fulva]KAK4614848.1 hypothetical protein CLAFUR0_09108 [Fulvia fulva]WPV19940.1 hypothetical protein CLAFUW4_09110 [Fulvia fulva]WPV34766.1 hypothetical protein CLAFUW7_09111 [Fulvia fulva]